MLGMHGLFHVFGVILAWFKLFGTPSLIEFYAIIIHDAGYLRAPYDRPRHHAFYSARLMPKRWRHLVLGHSKTVAAENDLGLSKLYFADKAYPAMLPLWLLKFMALCDKKFTHCISPSQIKEGGRYFLTTASTMG